MNLSKNIRLKVVSSGSASANAVRGTRGVKVYTGRRGRPVVIDKKAEGAWLKGELVSAGLSVKKAADLVGIPYGTMQSYVYGYTPVRPYTHRLIVSTLARHCKSRVSVCCAPDSITKCRVVGKQKSADYAQRAAEVYSGMVQIMSEALPRSSAHDRNLSILTRRFFGGETMEGLAKEFGLTTQRVSHLIKSTLARIRGSALLSAKTRELGAEIAALKK